MQKIWWIRLTLVTLAAVCASALARGAGMRNDDSRAEFMRRKLEYSKLVLDGLTREDFTKIAKNAKALKDMSEAAEWAEMDLPNPRGYELYALDFQRLCDLLGEKAKAKNLDGATLVFTQLAVNCVNCHSHVRTAKK
jgi:hypothetical protein